MLRQVTLQLIPHPFVFSISSLHTRATCPLPFYAVVARVPGRSRNAARVTSQNEPPPKRPREKTAPEKDTTPSGLFNGTFSFNRSVTSFLRRLTT